MNDRYLSPLHIPEGTSGSWRVRHVKEPAGKKFELASKRCQLFGNQPAGSMHWSKETIWHSLQEDGHTWMSDVPCERAQHLRCLKGMRGRILLGGLGLGLAASLLAKRRTVQQIVVVEKQREVIDLVAPYLHDPAKKISVVEQDLLDYLRELAGPPKFDHAFYDIWCSDGEATFFETVCPLYELSNNRIRQAPVNWNEDVMRGQLFCSLQQRLLFDQHKEFMNVGLKPVKQPCLWEADGTDQPWHIWSVAFFRWRH